MTSDFKLCCLIDGVKLDRVCMYHSHNVSQRALNGIAEAQVDIFRVLLGIDSDQVTRVLSLGRLEELAIVLDLRLHARHVPRDQLASNTLVGRLCLSWREQLARCLVELHARKLLQHGFVRNFERNHLLRLDLQITKQFNLLHVEGATV